MIKNVDLYIENYGFSSFVYLEIEDEDSLDREMVNKVNAANNLSIIPMTIFRKHSQQFIRYELVSDTTLEDYLSEKLTKKKLISCISNILEAMIEAEESGLDKELLLLDKQSIYVDAFSNRLLFLAVPVKTNTFEKVSLQEFFRELLTHSPFEEEESLFFVRLHNLLLSTFEASPAEWMETLQQIDAFEAGASVVLPKQEELTQESSSRSLKREQFYRPGEVNVKTRTTEENGVHTSEVSSRKTDRRVENNRLEIEEELQYKRITRTDMEKGKAAHLGESLTDAALKIIPKVEIPPSPSLPKFEEDLEEEGTTVLGGPGVTVSEADEEAGTTMLGVENYSTSPPYLLTAVMREKIEIPKSLFKIGRDPNTTDYHCQNKVVGRIHAHILHENGQYYLEDNDSRNGSYVNDRRLHPKEKVKIRHDDRIKLANEEFIFKLF